MSTPDIEVHHQLEQLILRYFAAIDDKTMSAELFAELFARDGSIQRPRGPAVVGPQAIFESQNESFARFRVTQHILTGLLFSRTDDGWKVRGNLQAMHIWAPESIDPTALETYFLAHSVLEARFVQEDGAWKIAGTGIRVVWRTGSGMMSMLQTK